MARRFIDTGFFKSPFVRGMDASCKLLYQFVICDCSPAGIWVVDFEIASMYCGVKITKSSAEKAFLETGKAVDLGNGKWFFPDFISHQYPGGLAANNRAHTASIEELKRYGLVNEDLSIKGDIRGLQDPKDMVMVMEEVMVKDKVKVKDAREELILPFDTDTFREAWADWKAYKKTEHRFSFKSPKTEQTALNELAKDAGDETTAIAMIKQAIAKNWKGLYELKSNGIKPDAWEEARKRLKITPA